METIYQTNVEPSIVVFNLNRIGNQIFKLLPMNEEGKDWIKPLETIIIELSGILGLFPDQTKLFSAICKLQGIKDAGQDVDFLMFRRCIFETCGLVMDVKKDVSKNS